MSIDKKRSFLLVLKKYLDPQLWKELEHGVKRPVVIVVPPEHSGTTPRLAKAIRGAVGERDFWQGTPSELLALIGSSKQGIPTTALKLSIEIMKPHMTVALKSYGMTVERKRTAVKRFLQLSHSADTSGNMVIWLYETQGHTATSPLHGSDVADGLWWWKRECSNS